MGEAGLMNTVFQSSSSVRKATPHISPLIRHTQSFQSPPSVRKATSGNIATWPSYYISIPAFREEGDARITSKSSSIINFNPRLP